MARVNIEAVKEAIYDLIEAGEGVYDVSIEDDQFDNERYYICTEWERAGTLEDFEDNEEEIINNPVYQYEYGTVWQPYLYIGHVPRDCYEFYGLRMIEYNEDDNYPCETVNNLDDVPEILNRLLAMYERYSKPLKEAWEEKEEREWCAENNVALDDGTSFDSCIFDLTIDEKYSECYETVAVWAMEEAIYNAVKEHGPFDNIQALHECLIHEYI